MLQLRALPGQDGRLTRCASAAVTAAFAAGRGTPARSLSTRTSTTWSVSMPAVTVARRGSWATTILTRLSAREDGQTGHKESAQICGQMP